MEFKAELFPISKNKYVSFGRGNSKTERAKQDFLIELLLKEINKK